MGQNVNKSVPRFLDRCLAKVGVAGSSPVSRSFNYVGSLDFTRLPVLFINMCSDYL